MYVNQQKGFIQKGCEDKVYKLQKALYELRQAPRAWFSKIESYFITEGFERCSFKHTLFVKTERSKILIVSLYVDDLIFTGKCAEMFESFKVSMKNELDMTDLGKIRYFFWCGSETKQ